MRPARALACVAAVAVIALGACGGPQGRLDAVPDTRGDGELRIGGDTALDVSPTTPPRVVNVPPKPGAANCRLVIRPMGCFDTTQQLIQLIGGGIQQVRNLGG